LLNMINSDYWKALEQVRSRTLTPSVLVRIQVPQPSKINHLVDLHRRSRCPEIQHRYTEPELEQLWQPVGRGIAGFEKEVRSVLPDEPLLPAPGAGEGARFGFPERNALVDEVVPKLIEAIQGGLHLSPGDALRLELFFDTFAECRHVQPFPNIAD